MISLCAKKHSNQTTKEEFSIIEKGLKDPIYAHWPKSSIYSLLVKEGKLTVCRTTFYKYAKQIEPKRKRINNYKKKRPVLRATKINELWHLDISQYKTLDGKKHYIYVIIDNYSRKILQWRVESKIRSEFVSKMLLLALGVDKPKVLKIMSDGGRENIGKHVKIMFQKYIIRYGAEVKHMIALKDIEYSNNMIERFFSIADIYPCQP